MQLERFERHLTNEVGLGHYKLFVNDVRALRTDSIANRRLGVATYLHRSLPGFDQHYNVQYTCILYQFITLHIVKFYYLRLGDTMAKLTVS